MEGGEGKDFNQPDYVYVSRALHQIRRAYADCYTSLSVFIFVQSQFSLSSFYPPMTHLGSLLLKVLPSKCQFELLHLQSPPAEISPLVTTASPTTSAGGKDSSLTVKTQHFFALCNDKKVVYGLEVHVYITFDKGVSSNDDNVEHLLFVSKADTNGYSTDKFSTRLVTLTLLEYLLSIDPNYYLIRVIPLKRRYKICNGTVQKQMITRNTSPEKALRILSSRFNSGECCRPLKTDELDEFYLNLKCSERCTTKLCMFTRPADQYLFPRSSENPKKHILGGVQLLKWWVSILDELLIEKFEDGSEAKLRIPGEAAVTVKRFLHDTKYPGWTVGDIFNGEENGRSLAVFNIPLFPDDPKSRFLHQLVEDNRIMKVTLDDFWMELQCRQEFKLSVVVSVVGIQGHLKFPSSKWIPSEDEVVRTNSIKQFHQLKSYIVGEDYDKVDGALEAFTNISYILGSRMGSRLLSICGSREFIKNTRDENGPVQTVSVLKPRKKPKK